MKKIVSFLLAAAMCVPLAAPAFAASGSFPHAFWSMADNFANAQAAGGNEHMRAFGKFAEKCGYDRGSGHKIPGHSKCV